MTCFSALQYTPLSRFVITNLYQWFLEVLVFLSHLCALSEGRHSHTDLQHRSSNSIIFPPHPHIYAFTPIPLIAVNEMASANSERQNIPLRPLFSRPLSEALSPVDKPRQVTLPTQLAHHKKSATYNSRIEKHHTNSRKRRGRASPDLDQQFAGNLSRATVFTCV